MIKLCKMSFLKYYILKRNTYIMQNTKVYYLDSLEEFVIHCEIFFNTFCTMIFYIRKTASS